ncbi:MAG: hypothetical protein QM484_08690 [Woeseiaceae bacterium]
MIKYRHHLRFVKGDINAGNFDNFATITYEGSLPSAPIKGLVIVLADLVEFEISLVTFICDEGIYETHSHIDLLQREDKETGLILEAYEIARYVKYGFVLTSPDAITKEEIESELPDVLV